MKRDQFKKLVRPIIKEELYKVLNDILPSLLSEVVAEKIVPTPSHSQVRSPTKFSDNSVLNEILLQTKGGISDNSELVGIDGDFPVIGESVSNEVVNREYNKYSAGDHGQTVDIQEIEKVAPEVAKALTRDYSQLLKAVEQKKGHSQPSNIDFTNYHE